MVNMNRIFLSYEKVTANKLKNIFLAFLKQEYDTNPNQKESDLVNKFLGDIEMPKELLPVTCIPSFQLAIDLLDIIKWFWKPSLAFYPPSNIEITLKKPATSDKMVKYASSLLEKSGIRLQLEGMSYQELTYLIETYKQAS